jgi:hypothetical protein
MEHAHIEQRVIRERRKTVNQTQSVRAVVPQLAAFYIDPCNAGVPEEVGWR